MSKADGLVVIAIEMEDGSVAKGVANLNRQLGDIEKSGQKTGNALTNLFRAPLQALGNFGAKLQDTGSAMMQFGGGAQAALATVGVSVAGIVKAVQGGMERMDAMTKANMTFKSMGADADKSFGDVSTAAERMTKGTQMSLGDFGKVVDKYLAKGYPEAAAIATASINAFVKGTSISMPTASKSVAAFNATGMDLNRSVDVFKNMSKVLAGVGNATEEGMDQATDALQKMSAEGKVTLLSFKQFSLAVPNAMKIVSESMGWSMEDVRQNITDGKLSWEDFEKILTESANKIDKEWESVGGVMQATGVTFEGIIGNVKSAFNRLGESIINAIGEERLKKLISGIIPLFDQIGEKIAPIITKIADQLERWGPIIMKLLPTIGVIMGVGAAFFAVGKAVSKVGQMFTLFAQHPIIGMIYLLVQAFAIAYTNSETFRNAVHSLIEKLQPLVDWIKQVVGAIAGLFTGETKIDENNPLMKFANSLKDIALPIIDGAISFIRGIVSQIVQFWQENGEGIMKAVSIVFNAIMNIVNTVMPGIKIIIETVWSQIKNIIQTALDIIFGIIKVVTGLITGDWSKVWEGIKQIVVAVWDFMKNSIQNAINLIWGIIKTVFLAVWGFVKEIWEQIKRSIQQPFEAVKNFVSNTSQDMSNGLQTVWNNVKEFISRIVENIIKNIMTKFSGLIAGLQTIWNGIVQIAQGAWELLKNVILGPVLLLINLVTGNFNELKSNATAIWENIKNAAGKIWNGLKEVLYGIVQYIFGYIKGIFETLGQILSSIWTGIKNTASNIWEGLKNTVVNLAKNAIDGIKNAWNGIVSWVSGIFQNVRDTIKNLMNIDLYQIGKNIIQGLINGISNMIGNAVQAVTNVGSAIFNGIKGVLGIKSPSRLFRDEIGKMIPEGLALGITANTDSVEKAMREVEDVILRTNLSPEADLAGQYAELGSTSTSTSSVKNVVNHITQNIEWKGKEDIVQTMKEIANQMIKDERGAFA